RLSPRPLRRGSRPSAPGPARAETTGVCDRRGPVHGMTVMPRYSAHLICAVPRNMPFSDEQGEGFENKLATLLASKPNEPVSYTYYPQVIGFLRNTLNA